MEDEIASKIAAWVRQQMITQGEQLSQVTVTDPALVLGGLSLGFQMAKAIEEGAWKGDQP